LTRDRAGDQVGAGLDPIGQHIVTSTVQPLDALNHDRVGAGAANFCTHRIEEVGEIDHLRLTRRVLDDRLAFCERGGHHEILGAGHSHGLEHEPRTAQARCARANVTILDQDIGAELLQPVDVDVHRTRANGAAAGQRHVSLAEARQ
jgi:hypothetical protein